MKVAIIGTAPSSRDLAPYNDPSWQIWGCSPANHGVLPRVDVWFEMHPRQHLLHPAHRSWGDPYVKWLERQTIPVYVLSSWPNLPNATVYPLSDVVAEFSPHFFTSGPVYMIALAILKGATEIGIWGIDMATAEEYADQRPGCKFFMLEAVKRGIKFHLPPQSDLLTLSPLYGYLDESPMWLKLCARGEELRAQMQQAERDLEEAKYKFAFFKGAWDGNEYTKRTWVTGNDSPSARAQLQVRRELGTPTPAMTATQRSDGHDASASPVPPASVPDLADVLMQPDIPNGSGAPL